MRRVLITATAALVAACSFAFTSRPAANSAFDTKSCEELYTSGARLLKTRPDSALAVYAALGDRYSESMSDKDKEFCVIGYNNAAYVCMYHLKRYGAAFAYLQKARDIAERDGLDKPLGSVYLNLGNLYDPALATGIDPKWRAQGIQMYRKSLETTLKTDNELLAVKLFINLCGMFPETNLPERIRKDRDEVRVIDSDIEQFEHYPFKSGTPNLRFARLLAKGFKEMRRGEYAAAVRTFREQFPVADDPYMKAQLQCISLDFIAKNHVLMGNIDSAMHYERQLLDLATRNDILTTESYAYKALADHAAALGDTAQSRRWEFLYLQKNDSLIRFNGIGNIGESHFMYELHRESSRLQDEKSKTLARNIVIGFSWLLLMLAVGFTVVLKRNNKRLAEKNRVLFEQSRLISRAEAEIAAATEASEDADDEVKPTTQPVPDSGNALIRKIQKALSDPAILFDPELKMSAVARAVDSNTSYCSAAINAHYGMNFSILVGNLRVKELIRQMETDFKPFSNMTVEALSEKCGFKSRVTFTSAFKRVTGLTPSEYIKLTKENL